jgi:aspartate carbamoyltransferase catalytic subunit
MTADSPTNDSTEERASSVSPSGNADLDLSQDQNWSHDNLLDLERLTEDELRLILDTAESFKEVSTRNIKKVPALRGKVVVTLFEEPSTRTKSSFSLAAKRMSADVVNFSVGKSSVKKGESMRDTVRNIEAMGVDIFVHRSASPGAPERISSAVDASIINAGDGSHEHPTQALLDVFTIREQKGTVDGLTVAIVGDITHSRVARSNIHALQKLGAEVVLCGPSTLIPDAFRDMGVEISHDLDEVIRSVDVLNLLRIQLERQTANLFPSIREYTRLFGVNEERLEQANKDILIMHPGPINRGVEVTPDVADGPRSVILRQVTNGLAARMAVLYLVSTAQN